MQDGGSDDPDNLVALCLACHREWHAYEVLGAVPFAEWLDVPPLRVLVAAWLTPGWEHKSALDLRIEILQVVRGMKEETEEQRAERLFQGALKRHTHELWKMLAKQSADTGQPFHITSALAAAVDMQARKMAAREEAGLPSEKAGALIPFPLPPPPAGAAS